MHRIPLAALFLFTIMYTSQAQPSLIWANSVDIAYMHDAALDPENNILVLGRLKDSLDTDPGAGSNYLYGHQDAFITKLTPDGDYTWSRQLVASYPAAFGQPKITTDSHGSVIVGGGFRDSLDADVGPGTNILLGLNGQNGFIIKLDSSGNTLWAKQLHAVLNGQITMSSIRTDEADNIYIAGSYRGSLDMNPGSGVEIVNAGTLFHGFVLKLDENGDFVWLRDQISPHFCTIEDMETDAQGNTVAVGLFYEELSFDSNHAALVQNGPLNYYQGFIAKWNSDGVLQWQKHVSGNSLNQVSRVSIDQNSNIVVCGYFADSVDIDVSVGEEWLVQSALPSNIIYIAKYTADAALEWYGTMINYPPMNTANIFISDLISDNWGNTYFSGRSGYDYDINFAGSILSSSAPQQTYTAKVNPWGQAEWLAERSNSNSIPRTMVDSEGYLYNVGEYQEAEDFDPTFTGYHWMSPIGYNGLYVQKLDRPQNLKVTNNSDMAIRMSPNPVPHELQIDGVEMMSTVDLVIMDTKGAIAYSTTLKSDQTKVNVSNLEPGVYFISINDDSFHFVERIVKL